MSRSRYTDDCDGSELNLWRGAVNSAIKGKRGQSFLREALAALDAMPEKRLTTDSLRDQVSGEYCTLGVVGFARGINMEPLQDADREPVAAAFNISPAMAAEIMFENDEAGRFYSRASETETPEQRWSRMRAWIAARILPEPAP